MKNESIDKLPSAELVEAINLSKGVFGILPEESYYPEGHTVVPADVDDTILRETVDDPIRYELERVIDSLPTGEKIFVIQRLGLAHAIHNTCSLLERDIDVYTAQVSPIGDTQSGDDGYYNFKRNAEMWLWNKERVVEAKQELLTKGKGALRGIALSIDTHAGDEDRGGLFNKFFPTEEQLRELGITHVIFCEEVEPKKSEQLQRMIDTPEPVAGKELNTHLQLLNYRNLGFKVSAFGVDARHRDGWEA